MKNENETVLKTNEGRVNELLALFIGFDLFDKFISVDGVSRVKYKYLNSKGKPEHPYYGPFYPEQMSFNTSFDWLMPVWVKFRELKFDENDPRCSKLSGFKIRIASLISYGSIEDCFNELANGIEWYYSEVTSQW